MNWIICPVRNGLRYTQRALPSFFEQDIGDVGVFIVANRSGDGTTAWLRSQEPLQPNGAYLYWVHQNPAMSVAASWNRGIKWAFNSPAVDYVLVCNNDVILQPDTYRRLVEDGGQFVTGVGVDDPVALLEEKEVFTRSPHPSFSCFLMRRECWLKVGPFDERFQGAYVEDCDYHLRLHRAGVKAYAIDLPFYHEGSGTLQSVSPEEAREIREQADRNRALFRQEYGCLPGTIEYEKLFE